MANAIHKGTAQDTETLSFTNIERRAHEAHPESMYLLGSIYQDGVGDIARDLKQAAIWYRKAAKTGHATAARKLAMMHKNGQGVAKQPRKALTLLRQAAVGGDFFAQLELAISTYCGHMGLTPNTRKGLARFARLARRFPDERSMRLMGAALAAAWKTSPASAR